MSAQIHAIAVPKWCIEMVEGTLTAWNKEIGDEVSTGEELLELESDKIVNMLEAGGGGVLRHQLAEPGQTLQVGELLGIIADASIEESEIEDFIAKWQASESAKAGPAGAPKAANAPKPSIAQSAPAPRDAPASDARIRVSPVVRRLAAELDVELSNLNGTGRSGRITKEDVEAAAANPPSSVSAPEPGSAATNPVTEQAMSGMRRTIARRMQGAKQTIPHFYLSVDLPLEGLQSARASLNEEQGEQRVSVNDLIIWCIAQALIEVP